MWTTDELVADVRRKGFVPDADGDLASADILRLADERIALTITPRVRACRVAHWMTTSDASIVSGTTDYRIPHRAQGGGLADVLYVDSQGAELNMAQVPLEQAWRYRLAPDPSWRARWGFTVSGEVVRILPTPTASDWTLRLKYFMRRSRLVLTSAAGQITGFSSGTSTFTCATVPASWTNALTFDQIYGKQGFEPLAIDQAATTVVTGASGTVRFTTAPTTAPTIDANFPDYICKAGETCLIPLPVELHTALVTLTTSALMLMLKDPGAADVEAQGLAELEQGLVLITPRVEDELPRIINRSSPLRGRARIWWV